MAPWTTAKSASTSFAPASTHGEGIRDDVLRAALVAEEPERDGLEERRVLEEALGVRGPLHPPTTYPRAA